MPSIASGHTDEQKWLLDPAIAMLNHGSFGACPAAVLEHQARLRAEMEWAPVGFMMEALEPLLLEACGRLAAFLGASPPDLVPVRNATAGINAVLRSLEFQPGDELLITDHAYNACRNALNFVAERSGARVVVAELPFPVRAPQALADAVLACVSDRTRLALLDHVTSPTGLVLPIEPIIRALDSRGVITLIDGAHAPGMIDVDITALGAAGYAGNCHKWLCAPKGAGFLWVRPDLQPRIRPTVISHGANSTRTDLSRFQLEFFWTGTDDPTPFLCVPAALDALAAMSQDGWRGVRAHNHALCIRGREQLCSALGIEPPAPDAMLGAIASLPLPAKPHPPRPTRYHDDLQDRLIARGFQAPIIPWKILPNRLVRISAQMYNSLEQYQAFAAALLEALEEEAGGA